MNILRLKNEAMSEEKETKIKLSIGNVTIGTTLGALVGFIFMSMVIHYIITQHILNYAPNIVLKILGCIFFIGVWLSGAREVIWITKNENNKE